MLYDASQQLEINYASILINNARPTWNRAVCHSDSVWSTLASALAPKITKEDRRMLELNNVNSGIHPPN
jgi:hypothetical protein